MRHDDAVFGVALVAGVRLHAVGTTRPGSEAAATTVAAGTAEAARRPAVTAVVDELVVGGAEERVAACGPRIGSGHEAD